MPTKLCSRMLKSKVDTNGIHKSPVWKGTSTRERQQAVSEGAHVFPRPCVQSKLHPASTAQYKVKEVVVNRVSNRTSEGQHQSHGARTCTKPKAPALRSWIFLYRVCPFRGSPWSAAMAGPPGPSLRQRPCKLSTSQFARRQAHTRAFIGAHRRYQAVFLGHART